MISKNNIENVENDVLELIYKIVNEDEIINLKEGNFSHYKLDDESNSLQDDYESIKSNSAYKNFKDSLKKLQLSSMIKKVNRPKINQSISLYSHENDLLMQSIALDIAFLLKPLLSLSVNIIKEDNGLEEEKIQIIRDYFEQALKQIKNQAIKQFLSSEKKKKKSEADDSKNESSLTKIMNDKKFSEILNNLNFFNESLIQHLSMWIKLSLDSSTDADEINDLKPRELKSRISNMIDDFFEKNIDEILSRVQF